MHKNLTLVADVGGTHNRLALADGTRLLHDSISRSENAQHATFTDRLAAYLKTTNARPAAVCIAAAGPVRDGTVQLTNHSWHISARDIAQITGTARVLLLNDLQAMGHALALPAIMGSPLTQTRLVLAIGTGMNCAVAHPCANGVFVPPGESGYSTLPLTTGADAAVLRHVGDMHGTPVIESILSGPGLSRAHFALTGTHIAAEAITTPTAPNTPARSIHPGTADTLALALRVLGAHLGSLALTHLPLGGIALAGSVGRALFAHLDSPHFQTHYANRGPYTDLLTGIPLHQITDDTAPLHGAALAMTQAPPMSSSD
ncbi:glucokinase [Rhodobacteraceae bacterium D3-12]|nr:glucokinase [Rhodobacteraceae bacterium D3-12]